VHPWPRLLNQAEALAAECDRLANTAVLDPSVHRILRDCAKQWRELAAEVAALEPITKNDDVRIWRLHAILPSQERGLERGAVRYVLDQRPSSNMAL